MTGNPFRGKTALILGADTPVGRAAALQLTRAGAAVILAGYDLDRLKMIAHVIADKKGVPLTAFLKGDRESMLHALRECRDTQGHVHAMINAAATGADAGSADHAREMAGLFREIADGKGALRTATVWPDRIEGDLPESNPDAWHTVLRMSQISVEDEDGVKPGAVADAVLELLSCPPGACPVEVRLEPRNVKAI